MASQIIHIPAAKRFETTIEGCVAVLEYEEQSEVLVFTHTRVPGELRGRGIAGALTEAALAHARARGRRVLPQCSYVAAYLEKHGEHKDLVFRRE